MRAVWLMPMTFLAGVHGFAYFVPYLMFVGMIVGICAFWRKYKPQPVPVQDSYPAIESLRSEI